MPAEEHITVVAADGTTTTEVRKVRTCKDYFYYFVIFIRVMIVLMLACTLASYCIVIKFIVLSKSTVITGLEKAFVVIVNIAYASLTLAVILSEIERPIALFQRVQILYYWGVRGVLEVFLGSVTIASTTQMGSALAAEIKDIDSDPLVVFALVAGWMAISCGCVRILLSITCARDWAELESDKMLKAQMQAWMQGGTVQLHVTHTTNAITQKLEPTESKEFSDLETLSKNLSIALGINYSVAKTRFAGKKGETEAHAEFKKNHKTVDL